MFFTQIEGLAETKERLIDSVKKEHVAHAQMFLGREGTGNLALALAYATYLNCENRQEKESCGRCSSCVKMNKFVHPDFHFVYPTYSIPKSERENQLAYIAEQWRRMLKENPYATLADWSNQSGAEKKQCIISVEKSRQVIQNISLKAFEGQFKIVLMWLPELMNQEAANALLKALEEPPERTIFLMVSNDREKNLTTILSRCQIIQVPPFSEEEIKQTLVRQYSIDEEQAERAAYLSEGNMSEALHLTEGASNISHTEFRNWMRLCFSRNFKELITFSEAFQKMSRERQKGLLSYGMKVLREVLTYHSGAAHLLRLSEDDRKFIDGFAKVLGPNQIEPIYKQLGEAIYHVERNASPKITAMELSLQISTILRAGK